MCIIRTRLPVRSVLVGEVRERRMAKTKVAKTRPKKKIIGNYRNRKDDVAAYTFADLYNPFNFYKLLMSSPKALVNWLIFHRLLSPTKWCGNCNKQCNLNKRQRAEELVSLWITIINDNK